MDHGNWLRGLGLEDRSPEASGCGTRGSPRAGVAPFRQRVLTRGLSRRRSCGCRADSLLTTARLWIFSFRQTSASSTCTSKINAPPTFATASRTRWTRQFFDLVLSQKVSHLGLRVERAADQRPLPGRDRRIENLRAARGSFLWHSDTRRTHVMNNAPPCRTAGHSSKEYVRARRNARADLDAQG